MKLNVGSIDRGIRIALGIVLLALAFFGNLGVWGYVAGVAGAVALITGLVRWCPAWALFGVDTTSAKKP
jgi:hypothetical protein